MNAEITAKKLPGVPFQKGDDPRRNLEGRPKGSLSVIGKLKQIWEENPDDFELFVDEYRKDPLSRKHITEMIDGKPSQPIDANIRGDITINLVKYTEDDNTSPSI